MRTIRKTLKLSWEEIAHKCGFSTAQSAQTAIRKERSKINIFSMLVASFYERLIIDYAEKTQDKEAMKHFDLFTCANCEKIISVRQTYLNGDKCVHCNHEHDLA